MEWEVVLTICGVLILLVILQICAGNQKPVRSAFSGILLGWLTLLVVNIAGTFTGVSVPVSALSIGVSGAAGIPGVTMMVLLEMIL